MRSPTNPEFVRIDCRLTSLASSAGQASPASLKELTTSHTLYDFSDITQDIRVKAECKYGRALERVQSLS